MLLDYILLVHLSSSSRSLHSTMEIILLKLLYFLFCICVYYVYTMFHLKMKSPKKLVKPGTWKIIRPVVQPRCPMPSRQSLLSLFRVLVTWFFGDSCLLSVKNSAAPAAHTWSTESLESQWLVTVIVISSMHLCTRLELHHWESVNDKNI